VGLPGLIGVDDELTPEKILRGDAVTMLELDRISRPCLPRGLSPIR
jgi:hypothetical protein